MFKPLQVLLSIFRDGEYLRRLFHLALPITLQQFLFASLNLVGTLMVGQLGDTAVAAVGLSGQVAFLLNLLLFGVNSGASIFHAQYWGQKDVTNIRRVMGLALLIGFTGAALFTVLALFFPTAVLGVYSKDLAVVAAGSGYLRLIGLSFIFSAVTYTYSAVLRSTGNVRTPMLISGSMLALNMLLTYLLIFGQLGLPEMGIRGAALALVIVRVLEAALMLWAAYRTHSPAAASWREMLDWERAFVLRVLQRMLPVTANEMLWSFGITTYNVIYARIGTESIAAVNIAATIDSLAFVLFIGMGNACAILVGNTIGEGDEARAHRYAGNTLALAAAGGLLMGGLVLALAGYLLAFYKVSPEVIEFARRILRVVAFFIWLRASNMVLFVGVFRSGGDTRFGFLLDAGSIWLVGVPLAALAAFAFHLPVHQVYLCVMADEFVKFLIGMRRYASHRWIHNLALAEG